MLTPEIDAAAKQPVALAHSKLAQIRDEVWLDNNYAVVVCGSDPVERQRIARAIWARLKMETL